MLSKRFVMAFLCVLAAGAAGFGWWRAQTNRDAIGPAASAPVQSGVTAYLDEAGNLVEPPPDAVKQAAAGSRDFSRFTYESTPSGGVAVNFNDAWQSTAVGRAGEDGRISVQCVPGDGEMRSHAK